MCRISLLSLLSLMLLVVAVYSDNDADDLETAMKEFNQFTQATKRKYRSSGERQIRFANFRKTRSQVISHNAAFKNGETSFEMGLNDKFTDLSFAEISQQYTGFVPAPESNASSSVSVNLSVNELTRKKRQVKKEYPTNYDLIQYSPNVYDQSRCGSCYNFVAMASIEIGLAIRGKNVTLSKQFVLDCARNAYMIFGCGGGQPFSVWDWLNGQNGAPTDESYPYVGAVQGSCKNADKSTLFKSVSYKRLLSSDSDKWHESMITCNGTIAAAVYVSYNFAYYKSGIFNDNRVNRHPPNHAVVIIGWGYDNATSTPYWLIKSTWGASWGQNGIMKIVRGQNVANIELMDAYILCSIS